MLLTACCGLEVLQPPTTQFLVQLSASCRAQQNANRQHYVHWSRHLLANIRMITDVERKQHLPHDFPTFVFPTFARNRVAAPW